MRSALIIGSAGQDGKLLTDRLSAENYRIVGVDINGSSDTAGIINYPIDIFDPRQIMDLMEKLLPDEIYHLAAHHRSSDEPAQNTGLDLYRISHKVHVESLLNIIEAIKQVSPTTRLFYASSCRVFGKAADKPQTEQTPLNPICLYGITKAAGLLVCRYYRQTQAIFASAGIMYNHESSYRRSEFISRRITKGVVCIHLGIREKIILGDLSARVDWGYAPDYVDAMVKILQLPKADDFIISTGRQHTVQEFVETAFGILNMDWSKHVIEDPGLITKEELNLVGDNSHLCRQTGWKSSVTFKEMVALLLDEAMAGPVC